MIAVLILIAAALVVLPAMVKIAQAIIDLITRLIAAGFVFGLAIIVLIAIASHGKLP